MDPHDPDEYLPVEAAGNVAGISPRTLRSWVRSGRLPAVEGQRGKLVRLGDVRDLAALTGRSAGLPAAGRHVGGIAGTPADVAGSNAGSPLAGSVADAPGGAVSPAARSQLEAVRDEWLRPLIDQITAQAEAIGRLREQVEERERRLAEREAEVARERRRRETNDAQADALVDLLERQVAGLRRRGGG